MHPKRIAFGTNSLHGYAEEQICFQEKWLLSPVALEESGKV